MEIENKKRDYLKNLPEEKYLKFIFSIILNAFFMPFPLVTLYMQNTCYKNFKLFL